MNEQEMMYFNTLSEERKKAAQYLDSFALSGVKESVVEKYSDQAHFIYELLQNADDAKATSARFELFADKLIFAHNGTRRFSLSDPKSEKSDKEDGKLGDINAICAVGGSSKTEGNSIGKFGIGFKSVFQYTSTPYIYDPSIFFKIENFIVPSLLNEDYSGRMPEETLFVFPFNHDKRSPQSSYEDIDEKLHSLVYPLLFLTNLKNISFKISDYEGKYEKNIEDTRIFENTMAELINITSDSLKNQGEDQFDTLWLFSREDENKRRYSVGYFKKENLMPKTQSAFCFFPTKETTGLNFIIHAPFLLTDSRETIRAGEKYNKNLINMLAELAADSLVYLKEIGLSNNKRLIDDKIFDIIPYEEDKFDVNDKNSISFKPFYTAIKETFNTKKIIPTTKGYTTWEHAYWASTTGIAKLFTNEQLADLMCDPQAEWAFANIGHQEQRNLLDYIKSIIYLLVDENRILSSINTYDYDIFKSVKFVEKQPIDWLHHFYKWIDDSDSRRQIVRYSNMSIFLNKNGHADSAFKFNGEPNIFLPTEEESEYNTVDERLVQNEKTLEFFKWIGIHEPDLKDEIYNFILPKYENRYSQHNLKLSFKIRYYTHFKKIFRYYKECSKKDEKPYIEKIKNIPFLLYKSALNEETSIAKSQEIYFPDDESLKSWFETKMDTKFLWYDKYLQLVGEDEEENLRDFFNAIGVKNAPRILERQLYWKEAHEIRKKWDDEDNVQYAHWYETYIDGCKEIIESIVETQSIEKSKLVWSKLLQMIEKGALSLCITYEYKRKGRGNHKEKSYDYWQESSDNKRLQNQPWLLNNNEEFVPANELTVQTLNHQYDISSDRVLELFKLLGIKEEEKPNTDLSAFVKQHNLTDDEAYQALLEYANRKNAENLNNKKENTLNNSENSDDEENTSPYHKSIVRVTKELSKRASERQNEQSKTHESSTDETYSDEDDYSKRINVKRKIEKIKSNTEKEIEKIVQMEDLEQKASEFDTYSYGWFKTLLELESLISDENNYNSREISISFAKVERDTGTSRTLILRHPNRYIPQSMEELTNIPLELHFAKQPTVTAEIEVVNVKSYTLLAKLRTNVNIDDVDLSLVTEASIKAQNPVFLIKELKSVFEKLEYDDDFNMRDNLCENIEFIFGPPGTGKTTYLAKNIIVPIMKSLENNKVLVLTPTNKSADVLTQRIMEVMGSDCSYQNWLVRFGTTNDNVIEKNGVCRDKTFDIRKFQSNVTITTIARFSYDFFMPENSLRLHLKELNWDYIIIDEASMIPLVNIIYPLYKKEPKKFIIAGDPFQIEPITKVSLWKDENIYSMVELNSFTSPSTIPNEYHVELLKTQYRSIPSVGEIFSQLSYGGILNHFRKPESRQELPTIDGINVQPLNIIKFPVSKYESVYRPKRLQNRTPYQAYSALFSYEFIKYISSFLAKNEKEKYRIGLITPYGAQADLIDKLMSSFDCPKNIDVQIGTIHGFQGDECDIVIALFNPPPSISDNKNIFLNNLNIVNVAVSRAKDYLFVIMPDDDTENADKLTLIKRVEQICKKQNNNCSEYLKHDIKMFGNKKYIEDNSFTTNHQLVNVYGKPEKRYEIRSEDNAVDVQIHELN